MKAAKERVSVPVGPLRFIQLLHGGHCDCCTKGAFALFADDEFNAFGLSWDCAIALYPMEHLQILADKVRALEPTQSFKFPLPAWKKDSGREYAFDVTHMLKSRFGVTRNFYIDQVGQELKATAV